jgi:hypothetical protein
MSNSDIINTVKEVGGVFKFGSGVLGKSAIALGILMIAVIVAAARLRSDGAIIAVIAMGALIFFAWFAYVLKFAGAHPDAALLEGAEWSGYQRFQATVKGLAPSAVDQHLTLPTGEQAPSVPEAPKEQEST